MNRSFFCAAFLFTLTAASLNASLAHLPSNIAHGIAAGARALSSELLSRPDHSDAKYALALESLREVSNSYDRLGEHLESNPAFNDESDILLSVAQASFARLLETSSTLPTSMVLNLSRMIGQNDRLVQFLTI